MIFLKNLDKFAKLMKLKKFRKFADEMLPYLDNYWLKLELKRWHMLM